MTQQFSVKLIASKRLIMYQKTILLLITAFPLFLQSQLSNSLAEMTVNKDADFTNYEQLLYEATEYIFDSSVNFKSKEYVSACKIVDFWKNEDTGINVPLGGDFYNSLNPKSNQRYFYMIAITNHILNQKLNHNRFLKCVKIEGQNFSEQDDVREVQLEGARIFLDYASNEKNKIQLNSKSKKFLKAHKKGKLEDIFFK